MALRARKVSGASEKGTPGPLSPLLCSIVEVFDFAGSIAKAFDLCSLTEPNRNQSRIGVRLSSITERLIDYAEIYSYICFHLLNMRRLSFRKHFFKITNAVPRTTSATKTVHART